MCEEIRGLGIDTFITANGGYVKHKNEVIHKNTMDRKVIQEVFEFAQKENDALSFYTEEFTMNGIENKNTLKALKETLSLNEYPGTAELTLSEEVFLMCLFANDESAQKYVSRFPNLTFRRWHPFKCITRRYFKVISNQKYFRVLQHR
jgi:hydroxymethylpyrimidine pyrophosphatase-like HAD family hydrolase